jgi:hypothetical protein
MREIPAELLTEPFTVAMAACCGVTYRQLQGKRFRRLFRNVYVAADLTVTVPVLARALTLVIPEDAVISSTAGAWLLGADVRRRGDLGVEVTMLRRSKITLAGIRPTEAYLEPGDVVDVMGARVTSPVRTAFDLARQRDLIERVVGIDAMLNRGGCTLEALSAYIADRPHWRGIRWAREALAYAEPRAQSPMETRQRMRLVLGGLPRPVAQYKLHDMDGVPFADLDHAYPEWKVGPEWDGDPHKDRWRYDNERSERIRELGWWHRRYTTLSIVSGWSAMVGAVGRALTDRGWRPP